MTNSAFEAAIKPIGKALKDHTVSLRRSATPEIRKDYIIFHAFANYLKQKGPTLSEANDACLNNNKFTINFTKNLYCAVNSLLYSTDTIMRDHQKITSLESTYPYANIEEISFRRILSYIKGNLTELSGNFTKYDIAQTLATAVDEQGNTDLTTALSIDLDSLHTTAKRIQITLLNNLYGTDSSSIALSLYQNLNWPSTSKIQGLTSLGSKINHYIENNNLTGEEVATNINIAIANLSGNFTLIDLVNSIVNTIDANNDSYLIRFLNLDLASFAKQQNIDNASQIQSLLNNINGQNGIEIANNLYSALNYSSATSIAGLISFSEAIETESSNLDYTQILSNIKGNISTITSDLNNHNLANSIVYSLGKSNERLSYALEIDMNSETVTPTTIATSISTINGNDAYTITAALYSSWNWGNGAMSTKGLHIITQAINRDLENNITDIADRVNNKIQSLNNNFTLNDIAITISNSITKNYYNSDHLIKILDLDIQKTGLSPLEAQTLLSNVTGNDAPSITTSIYSSLNWPNAANTQGLYQFMDSIYYYEKSDNAPIFYLSMEKLQESLGDISLNITVPHFNLCYNDISNDAGEFYVAMPLFADLIVSSTATIYETLGRCTAIAELFNTQEFYISKTQPFGTTGTAEETGCQTMNSTNIIDFCSSAFL